MKNIHISMLSNLQNYLIRINKTYYFGYIFSKYALTILCKECYIYVNSSAASLDETKTKKLFCEVAKHLSYVA